jgi:hypothetical protein
LIIISLFCKAGSAQANSPADLAGAGGFAAAEPGKVSKGAAHLGCR